MSRRDVAEALVEQQAYRCCRACGRHLPLDAFPIKAGRARRSYCRACYRARMRIYWRAYYAARADRLRRQISERRQRAGYRPNRRLMPVIARARQQAQSQETRVGYYALLRAIFAIPEHEALP